MGRSWVYFSVKSEGYGDLEGRQPQESGQKRMTHKGQESPFPAVGRNVRSPSTGHSRQDVETTVRRRAASKVRLVGLGYFCGCSSVVLVGVLGADKLWPIVRCTAVGYRGRPWHDENVRVLDCKY